jgi:DNA primase
MAGYIRDEDVAYVRENTSIDEIIGEYVQLKHAGTGQKKGLCPFHDEKSPSFHVTPSKGYFHCFGCQTGGDVFAFLMKLDHLTFSETVERLAERLGFTLTYDQRGNSNEKKGPSRARLVAANTAAMEFYHYQLMKNPASAPARELLQGRNFTSEAATHFQIGYAPDEWDSLRKELIKQNFTDEELLAAGLTKDGSKGPIDRFKHRVMWPIKDITGEVIGFGGRKLHSDDKDSGPKYLNTPETSVYKKSQVLYGLDLAKKDIVKNRQVVVVEGYSDVMACHLAGITTAVATCGTAFGDDHIRIIRRLLMDDTQFRGEIIFTFDGDAAGQKAALRAFNDDQKFVSQTFVAVEPSGMDPCDLRKESGDGALRALISSRTPLFEFAMKYEIARHDLTNAEGRVSALNAVAPLVNQIRDLSLRPEYARQIALWLGMEVDTVIEAIKRSARSGPAKQATYVPSEPAIENVQGTLTIPQDQASLIGREVLKIKIQHPELMKEWSTLSPQAFPFFGYTEIRKVMDALLVQDPSTLNIDSVIAGLSDERVVPIFRELIVEPIRSDESTLVAYSTGLFFKLQELAAQAEIAELKSSLSRLDPAGDEYASVFSRLIEIEGLRRNWRQQSTGDTFTG